MLIPGRSSRFSSRSNSRSKPTAPPPATQTSTASAHASAAHAAIRRALASRPRYRSYTSLVQRTRQRLRAAVTRPRLSGEDHDRPTLTERQRHIGLLHLVNRTPRTPVQTRLRTGLRACQSADVVPAQEIRASDKRRCMYVQRRSLGQSMLWVSFGSVQARVEVSVQSCLRCCHPGDRHG